MNLNSVKFEDESWATNTLQANFDLFKGKLVLDLGAHYHYWPTPQRCHYVWGFSIRAYSSDNTKIVLSDRLNITSYLNDSLAFGVSLSGVEADRISILKMLNNNSYLAVSYENLFYSTYENTIDLKVKYSKYKEPFRIGSYIGSFESILPKYDHLDTVEDIKDELFKRELVIYSHIYSEEEYYGNYSFAYFNSNIEYYPLESEKYNIGLCLYAYINRVDDSRGINYEREIATGIIGRFKNKYGISPENPHLKNANKLLFYMEQPVDIKNFTCVLLATFLCS